MSKRERILYAVGVVGALSLALAFLYQDNRQSNLTSTSEDEVDSSPTSNDQQKAKECKKHPLERKEVYYDGCIYMDYNATTPIYSEVKDSMEPFLTEYFGNPSSSHHFGPTCKRAVDLARFQVAKLISSTSPADEIIFTSCGTESDNRAIDIAIHEYLSSHNYTMKNCPEEELPEVVTTAAEHPAVVCYLRHLAKHGFLRLVIIPVNNEGLITLADLEKALTRRTALVSIMHSNNEVGTLQPIRAIAHSLSVFNRREKTHILFHTDAAQSAGKVPMDVNYLGVDMLTLVGHKVGAPKGIGVLYIKRTALKHPPAPLLVGGGQEKGRRAGTENVPYIVGLGTAAAFASSHILENILQLLTLKLQFLTQLQTQLQSLGLVHLVKFNGPRRSVNHHQLQEDMKVLRLLLHSSDKTAYKSSSTPSASATDSSPDASRHNSPLGEAPPRRAGAENSAADVLEQLPNTVSVSFRGLIGHEIVAALSHKVACSAGSACHSITPEIGAGHIFSTGDSTLLVMRTEDEDAETGPVRYTVSDVLHAMHVPEDIALGTVRLSFGRYTVSADVETAVRELLAVVVSMWRSRGMVSSM